MQMSAQHKIWFCEKRTEKPQKKKTKWVCMMTLKREEWQSAEEKWIMILPKQLLLSPKFDNKSDK